MQALKVFELLRKPKKKKKESVSSPGGWARHALRFGNFPSTFFDCFHFYPQNLHAFVLFYAFPVLVRTCGSMSP
jgi:hypothetical protein